MAKKLNSVIGIDIGSQRIKVCEMRSQGRDPVITALGIIDTPEGAVDHTGVFNSDAVGAALKQCLNDSGAASPFAIVSIAGQTSVLVRTLEVPKMNPTELKDHMAWEINRNIPFADSNVVSDFKALGDDDPNSTNMDVVMAIAPQPAIDTMIACVKKAGRTPAAIDVEPMSMARSIQTSYGEELALKTICMVDMGHKTTSINIFKGAKLLMPRQIPIGGEMFTKAIADSFTISTSDAETMKRTKLTIPESAAAASGDPFTASGVTEQFQPYNPFSDEPAPTFNPVEPAPEPQAYGGPFADEPITDEPPAVEAAVPAPDMTPSMVEDHDSIRIYNAVAPVLEEFVAEVRRSIDYFRSRGGEVDTILLSGGGTKIGGLKEFLSKTLAVECDNYDPFRRLNINDRRIAPDFSAEHRQEFAVAVGNGLHIFFD